MKVEIWSDVMCPFCYIGKRRFELALQQFPGRDGVAVEWKSFQLDPEIVTQPGKSVNEYLAERKGWPLEEARRLNDHVTEMARGVGLQYDFDKAVVANSFDAHRLSHFAKKQGLQDAMEERLFRAYFTEGKNTANHETLVQLAAEIGLKGDDVRKVLASKDFADDVKKDIYEAHQVGVLGVPFFVFDNKYAVSGAQPTEVFAKAFKKAAEK